MGTALRDQARQALRLYMSGTGMDLREIAEGAGYAHRTPLQFPSGARFGTPETTGEITARRLVEFFQANPAPLPELPGKL